MVVRKNPKVKKQRGHKTHGWGSMKKNRGAGNKGGKGNAGSGKRGDSRKPTLWKKGIKLGKFGFKKYGIKKEVKTIDLSALDAKLDELVKSKKASVDKDIYTINLSELGYTKLLGRGKITKKVNITVGKVTGKATDKVTAAGGQVNAE
jgi:large subunit ribosomal protein L15